MGLFDFLNNVPSSNQNNQHSQPITIPWNTRGDSQPTQTPAPSQNDWNSRSPMPTTGQGGFFDSAPFSNAMNWQQNMQNAPQPQPAQQPSASSSGGFFSNVLNHVKDAAGVVGGKFDQFEHATGLDHIKGAMQGLMNPTHPGTNITPEDGSYFGNLKNWGSNALAAFKNLGQSTAEGFMHPDQAKQGFSDQTQKDFQHFDPVSRMVLNLMAQTTTDPLSYVPVGGMAKALGTGIKTVSDATKLTPIVNAASSALRNAPMIKPAIDNTKDVLGNLFKKGYGTSADTMPTMDALHGNMSADQYAIQQKMAELAKTHNLNPTQVEDLAHHIDGRPTLDPQVQQSAQQLKDILSGGFQSQHGRVYGTDAELRNSHMSPAPSLQNIFNGNAGSAIRQGARENYYPHRYNNTPEEVQSALQQLQSKSGLSTNGAFNQQRGFENLQEAINHGLKPEMNPYVAIGQRLGETSKSLRSDEAIKQLLYSDVVKTSHAPGTAESLIRPFDPHVINVLDPAGGEKGILQKYFMNPEDQAAIKQSLDPAKRDTGYDKLVDLWKKITLLNPAVHGHNIAYNGMYLGGANPAYVAEHMGNLIKGASDPWYERALASGAVSSDTLRGKSLAESLKNAVAPEEKSVVQKALGAIGYTAHGSLWDADKAMRTSIFREAVEKGATDAEAAAKANKYLVNYNNTTPFENSVMKRIFPFYSWMKGNLPLQAEQMISNTPKQLFAQNATNAASQAISGEDAKDGKMGTGQVLSDGSEVKIDPYMPSAEPGKVMDQGPLAFLYGRSNPILKEILSQVLNKAYYPSSTLAPTGKEGMAAADITNPEAPAGYNDLKRGVHAANSVLPLSGVVGSIASGVLGGTDSRGALNNLVGLPNKDKPPTTIVELLTKALGGFSSRSNPAADAVNQQYQNKDSLLNQIKYLRETGQVVPKQLQKQAYRRVRKAN